MLVSQSKFFKGICLGLSIAIIVSETQAQQTGSKVRKSINVNSEFSSRGSGCSQFCDELQVLQSLNERKKLDLLTDEEVRKLSAYKTKSDLLADIDSARSTKQWKSAGGYSLKLVGYGLNLAKDEIGDLLGSKKGGKLPAGRLLRGGAATIGIKVAGDLSNFAGDYILRQAEEDFKIAVLLHLDKTVESRIIGPDGKLNRKVLANIRGSDLEFIQSAEFMKEIGNPQAYAQIQNKILLDQNSLILTDTTIIRETTSEIRVRLIATSKVVTEIQETQKFMVKRQEQSISILKGVNNKIDRTGAIVDAIAISNLPKSQVLALARQGALDLGANKEEILASLTTTVRAENIKAQFDESAQRMAQVAQGLSNIKGMENVAAFASQTSSVFENAGSLAAAWVVGDPISIASSGLNLFGALQGLGGIGGKKKPSAEVKMLAAVLEGLQKLQETVIELHKQEMQLLAEISVKLDNLEDLINRRFAELMFDVSLIQFDVREMLFDDIRVCKRLVDEYVLPETQKTFNDGLIGFGRWFESDARGNDYNICLAGLIGRQQVDSEADYSGVLRSSSTEGTPGGAFADARRDAVRHIEQGILQPTVDFTRLYLDTSNLVRNRDWLYKPLFTSCQLLANDTKYLSACPFAGVRVWPESRISFSNLNPGQGALLSSDVALTLAEYTRTVAPWNTALVDRTTAAVSRVMSKEEASTVSLATASKRTRHLAALANAVDVLDLNIAQSQILAGHLVVEDSADILDTIILPAYASAKLLGRTGEINKLLAGVKVDASRTGANCATDHREWNILCMMQTNSLFASNVIRTLLTKRLARNSIGWKQWKNAIRDPFSPPIQKLIGNDVIIVDASGGRALPGRQFGAWAIEIPRVQTVPLPDMPKDKLSNCWDDEPVPEMTDDIKDYYHQNRSAKCYMLDGFTTTDFTTLATPTNFSKLVSERMVLKELLDNHCRDNPLYPESYCPHEPAGNQFELQHVAGGR